MGTVVLDFTWRDTPFFIPDAVLAFEQARAATELRGRPRWRGKDWQEEFRHIVGGRNQDETARSRTISTAGKTGSGSTARAGKKNRT